MRDVELRTSTAFDTVYVDINEERFRAHAKHARNGDSMETAEWDDPAWLPVLVEEIGEVARVLCEMRHQANGKPGLVDRNNLREELVQVAAMATAWIRALS